jgi:hypothetical protein
MTPNITIKATDHEVTVVVSAESSEEFVFRDPAMLTGADLREVLAACGIRAQYSYRERYDLV